MKGFKKKILACTLELLPTVRREQTEEQCNYCSCMLYFAVEKDTRTKTLSCWVILGGLSAGCIETVL
jgi:hypothetical protein